MAESFFQRWSRRKAEQTDGDKDGKEGSPAKINPAPALVNGKSVDDAPEQALPTLDDVAQLTRDSDYSLFLSKGVDRDVRHAAMKKLFADPHFNVMDGLDIYIDDYTKPSPLTPAMLAALQHTQSMFEAVAVNEQERKERDDALAREAAAMQEAHALADEEACGNAVQEQDSLPPGHMEDPIDEPEFSTPSPHAVPNMADEPGNSIRPS